MLKLGDAKADADKARKRWNVSAAAVIKVRSRGCYLETNGFVGWAGNSYQQTFASATGRIMRPELTTNFVGTNKLTN